MSQYFKCNTNKPPLTYKCGETITFTVTAKNNCCDMPCRYVRWTLEGDDGKKSSGLGTIDIAKPLILETTLDRPGYVHLVCQAFDCDNNLVGCIDSLDAGAGAEIEKLAYCDTVPEDFDQYWSEIEKKVADFPLELLECAELTHGIKEGFRVFDVKIKTPSGRPASGYITYPKKEGKYPIRFEMEGYSVVGAYITYCDNCICARFNAHGIENTLDTAKIEVIEKYPELNDYGFNKEENSSEYDCYWRNMMIRNLIAAKYVKTLDCWDGENFVSRGGSQGAFQATTLAAHDSAVTALEIAIPWFCNLNAENCGYLAGWRPEFAEGLRYFDTVAQATRVKCPVFIDAGLGDYICPPSTVTVLYNSFKTEKALNMMQARTHPYIPPEWEISRLRFDPKNPSGEVRKGIYRHFKGKEYEVLGTALNCETLEETVIYKALYGEGKLWIRPKWEFTESFLRDNKVIKRFEFLD